MYLLENDNLVISNQQFSSRLMLGTGKYKNFQEANDAILASNCEILTVAIRRAQNSSVESIDNLLDKLDWTKIWLMPNTAGCQTSEQAIRLAFLGREILKNLNYVDNNFIKLEVIPDPKYLLPDSIGTLTAAEYLINKNFDDKKKLLLIETLWEIVLSDREIHDFESKLIRRLSGLLYISDVNSGNARKRALDKNQN